MFPAAEVLGPGVAEGRAKFRALFQTGWDANLGYLAHTDNWEDERDVASARDEDIALAQVLVPRLGRQINDMFRKVGLYADRSYRDPF